MTCINCNTTLAEYERDMCRACEDAEYEKSRELDVRIAEKVFGLQVVGKGCAVYVEGEWSIHLDSNPKGWACYANMEPLYVEQCSCHIKQDDWYKEQYPDGEPELNGHIDNCLRVVPHYSTRPYDSKLLLDKLTPHWAIGIFHVPPISSVTWGWTVVCEHSVHPPVYDSEPKKYRFVAARVESLEEALCLVALQLPTIEQIIQEMANNVNKIEEPCTNPDV